MGMAKPRLLRADTTMMVHANVAQLCVWNGSSLALESVKTWYWTGNTVINSVVLGDVDGDGQVEIVTGGYYNDGSRNIAQLCVWNGSSLALENVRLGTGLVIR